MGIQRALRRLILPGFFTVSWGLSTSSGVENHETRRTGHPVPSKSPPSTEVGRTGAVLKTVVAEIEWTPATTVRMTSTLKMPDDVPSLAAQPSWGFPGVGGEGGSVGCWPGVPSAQMTSVPSTS